MDEQKIKSYRERLEQEREKMMDLIRNDSKPEDFGNDVDDFSEEQDEAENFANEMAVVQAYKERVNEIDSALNRITSGTFGKCENCGRLIPEEDLDKLPETRFCPECRQKP